MINVCIDSGNLPTKVTINHSPASIAFYSATPIKLARTFILFTDLKGVIATPTAQNPAIPGAWGGLVATSSRGTQRSRAVVGHAIIRGLFQEPKITF